MRVATDHERRGHIRHVQPQHGSANEPILQRSLRKPPGEENRKTIIQIARNRKRFSARSASVCRAQRCRITCISTAGVLCAARVWRVLAFHVSDPRLRAISGRLAQEIRSHLVCGCQSFLANIQSQNADLFHHMHWRYAQRIRTLRQAAHIDARLTSTSIRRSGPETGFLSLRSWPRDDGLARRYRRWPKAATQQRHRRQEPTSRLLRALGLSGGGVIAVGDDCAAIPDGDGYCCSPSKAS